MTAVWDNVDMPIEQMNISLSPQMARFVRSKVRGGAYTNASEVVRDAIRRMQYDESIEAERARLAGFEASLSEPERASIRRSVRQGIRDIESDRYEELDDQGLKALGRTIVTAANRKRRRTRTE